MNTLSNHIETAIVEWRSEYDAFGLDPLGDAEPRVLAALISRVVAAAQSYAKDARDTEMGILREELASAESRIAFLEPRADHSEEGIRQELLDAYSIIGLLVHRLGGTQEVTESDERTAGELTVVITQDEDTQTTHITAKIDDETSVP